MNKLLYVYKSGPTLNYRVITSSETLSLNDNGKTLYIDSNQNCMVSLPLTSITPYGYNVTIIYINNNTPDGTVGITMQGSEPSNGYILYGRILPLNYDNQVKGFIFNSNTQSGDKISITLLGPGKGIYSGSVARDGAINFDD